MFLLLLLIICCLLMPSLPCKYTLYKRIILSHTTTPTMDIKYQPGFTLPIAIVFYVFQACGIFWFICWTIDFRVFLRYLWGYKFLITSKYRNYLKNSQSVSCPWRIVHFDHTFRPLLITDAYPWSSLPNILRAIRFYERCLVGAKVSDWNFVDPWALIPGVILITLEGVRRRRLAPFTHLVWN